MSEANPTPTPTPAPADAGHATADTPLAIDNSKGWTKVGDIIAHANKLEGQLRNPQAPEQYTAQAVTDFWKEKGVEFDAAHPEFQAFAASARSAGVSQAQFDKMATAFTEAVTGVDAQTGKALQDDRLTKVGGQEKLDALLASVEKAGFANLAKGASGQELLDLNKMISANAKAGGLAGPGANPPAKTGAQDGEYPEGLYATINGEKVGIDPRNNDSFRAFMEVKIGADKDGNGGRLFYKTGQGQQIYAKAQAERAKLLRDPNSGITVLGNAPSKKE